MAEPAEDRIHVIAPGGVAGTMSAEEFADRTKKGERFQLESEEARELRKYKEQSGIGTALRAGAEEAADTLSFGGYSAAGKYLGGQEFANNSRLARETSPVARTVGLAGGLILPALFTGGASAAAEGVGAAAEGARALSAGAELAEAASGASAASRGMLGLGRVATAPVRGAMALGHGAEHLTGSVLKGLGVTGETTLGKGVLGAAKMAAGGATEGALFGAGNAISEESLAPDGDYSRLAEKVIAGAKEGALFGAALGGAAGGITGVSGKFASKMADSIEGLKFGEIADKSAVKALAMDAGSAQAALERGYGTQLLKDDIIKGGRSYDDMLTRSQTVRRVADESISNTVSVLDDAGRAIEARPLFSRLEKEVIAPLARKDASAAEALRRELEPLAGEAIGFQDLHSLSSGMDPARIWGAAVPPRALREGIEKTKQILASDFERSAVAGIKSLSTDELRAIGMRRGISTEATGAAAAEHADAFAAAMTEGGALRAFEEANQSAAAADWAQEQLMRRARSGDDVQNALQLTDAMKGAAGWAAGRMLGHSLGGPILGTATSAASSYFRKHGRTIVADLAYRAQQADAAMVSKIRDFVRNTGKGSYTAAEQITHHKIAAAEAFAIEDHALGRTGKESREEAFDRTVQAVRNGAGNEPMLVHSEAPQTGDAMRAVIQRGMQFLQTKLPPGQGNPSPFYKPPPPGAETVAKFAKYVRAVKDPLSVLDSMNNGTLSGEEVEALKAVYPQMYEQIKGEISSSLAARKDTKPLPEAKSVQIGVLFGIPTVPMLEAGNYQIVQASYSVTTQGPNGGTKTTVSVKGPGAGALSKSFATEAERLEGQELSI